MAAICPSSVPVELGEGWLNKKVFGLYDSPIDLVY